MDHDPAPQNGNWNRPGWVGPHFFFDLKRLARRGRGFVLRVVYSLFLFVIMSTLFLMLESASVGQASSPRNVGSSMTLGQMSRIGESITQILLYWQCLGILMIAPPYFTSAILEEKSKRTLELLLTTHVRDHEIILGILGSRLVHLLGVWLAGLPILALAQSMGGVNIVHVVVVFLATILFLIMVGSVSITTAVFTLSSMQSLLAAYLICLAPVLLGTSLLLKWDGYAQSLILVLMILSGTTLITLVMLWLSIKRLRPETLRDFAWSDPTDVKPLSFKAEPLALQTELVFQGLLIEEEDVAAETVRSPSLLSAGEGDGQVPVVEAQPLPSPPLEVIDYVPHAEAIAPRLVEDDDDWRVHRHDWDMEDRDPLPPLEGDPLIWKETHLTRPTVRLFRRNLSMHLALSILGAYVMLCWFFLIVNHWTEYRHVTLGAETFLRGIFLAFHFVFTFFFFLEVAFTTSRTIAEEVEKDTLVSLLMIPARREWVLMCKALSAYLRQRVKVVILFANVLALTLMGSIGPSELLLHATTLAVHLVFITTVTLWISSLVRRTTWAFLLTGLFLFGFFLLAPMFYLIHPGGAHALVDYFLIGWNPCLAWWVTLGDASTPWLLSLRMQWINLALWTMLILSLLLFLSAKRRFRRAWEAGSSSSN